MLKSILAFLLSLSLLLTLIACGSEDSPQQTDSTPIASVEESAPSQEEIQSAANDPAESAESTDESTEAPTQSEQEPESKQPSSAPTTAEVSTGSVDANPPTSRVTTQTQPISEAESASVADTVSQPAPTPSTQPSFSVASTPAPIRDFLGKTMEELFAWIKDQQTRKNPAEAVLDSKGAPIQTLLVPKSVREDLLQDENIWVESETYFYYFRTYESSQNQYNECYRITITPLPPETKNWVNAIDDISSVAKPELKSSSYKGIDYIYVDGRKETNPRESICATAWFVYDNHIISIHSLWLNQYKPWNNEWFNYFIYENITL